MRRVQKTQALIARAEECRAMEPGHAERCELCAALDGCVEARTKVAESAALILEAASRLLAEAHLLRDETEARAPEKLASMWALVEVLARAVDEVQRWANGEEEKVNRPDDSRQW